MGILDTFLGKTGKKVAGETLAYNQDQAGQGYQNTKNYLSTAYNTAQGRLTPYSSQGRTAGTAYTNLLGLNGADAQGQATEAYQRSNPFLAATMDLQTKALDRRSAATGQFGSGLNALAKARVVDETASRDYQDYMSKLQALMASGMSADQALAALDSGYGGQMAGAESGYRNALMGAQGQYAKDYVQADMAPIQNTLGLIGAGINAVNAFKKPPTMQGGANYFSPTQQQSMNGYF